MVTIISFVIVLGILIFVHEFGHFIAARLCGVGVEKFSIGFGPKVIGWKSGETHYMISAIPLGGYVKMVGEEPDTELSEEEKKYSFTHKEVWKKFIIVAAGPFFNFFLAIILYFGLFMFYGSYFYPPVIGEVTPNTPSYGKLLTGDEILSVNDKKISSWTELEKNIEKSNGKDILLKAKRGNDLKEIVLKPVLLDSESLFGEKEKKYSLGVKPYLPSIIGRVAPDSPASKAGVNPEDRIVEINSKKIFTWYDVSKAISDSDSAIEIVFERNGERIRKTIEPEIKELKDHLGKPFERRLIGVGAKNITINKKLGPVSAMAESLSQTWKVIELTFVGIVKLINGSISKDNLGGPIMIAQMAGDQAKQGLTSFLVFISLISINLGLLNLLPVPVLDGGHLMFFLIEMVTRKPVSIKVRETAQQIGLFLLLTLMVFAFYNDILRLFSN
ncbi:MAG: RIP metalloprotease RseP [Desulforegulaceae bacterium]|nr:RIP metalloprotease RseP [Desulforegulaceae bacterium]